MCGIFCSLLCPGSNQTLPTELLDDCFRNLKNRGPDLFRTVSCHSRSGHLLSLSASVLQTQGKRLGEQPFFSSKNIFCWNGDVFGGPLVKEINSSGKSDTEVVSQQLCECILRQSSPLAIFNQITGPYSFIFYSEDTDTLWFGRDPAGRHSLLYGVPSNENSLIVSSVAANNISYLREVPAIGLFEVALSSNKMEMKLHPWFNIEPKLLEEVFCDFPSVEICVPFGHDYVFKPFLFSEKEPRADDFNTILEASKEPTPTGKMLALSNLETYHNNMKTVLALLEAAVKVRVENNLFMCQNCLSSKKRVFENVKENSCRHSKVAVLFSGGLDSAILAKLVDKYVPEDESIDLLNVAFEKKKSDPNNSRQNMKSNRHKSPFSNSNVEEFGQYDVPDRESGRKTLKELQNLCPKRKWHFVEIDVSLTELKEERSNCIKHLIHPLKTVLDDSLGCALWFAARGIGKIHGFEEIYRSPARVVFLGMGADEQFGGYMRHRTVLRNHGWEALQIQLQMELQRIPTRNLGRDDRVVSHHGRQPRMPFLDENVIQFVKSLHPWEKCCPINELPCGIGDKLLLRLVAWHIGLHGAALLPKRAMQFGSRIANSKENATDMSDRL